MKKWLALVALVALPLYLYSAEPAKIINQRQNFETPTSILATDLTVVYPGDSSNSAVRVNCVTGCTGEGGSFDGIIRDGSGDTTQANVSSGRLHVDGSGVTQPVSGTVTANVSTNVVPTGLTSLVTAQLAVTGSAQQLGSNAGKVVCLKVKDGGTRTVYYGPSGVTTGTGMELGVGESVCRSVDNSNRFFVIASDTGSTVSYEIWN